MGTPEVEITLSTVCSVVVAVYTVCSVVVAVHTVFSVVLDVHAVFCVVVAVHIVCSVVVAVHTVCSVVVAVRTVSSVVVAVHTVCSVVIAGIQPLKALFFCGTNTAHRSHYSTTDSYTPQSNTLQHNAETSKHSPPVLSSYQLLNSNST